MDVELQKPDPIDPLDRPLWGAKAIGAEVNFPERKAFRMLELGYLPGTKMGRLWGRTPRRLSRSRRGRRVTRHGPQRETARRGPGGDRLICSSGGRKQLPLRRFCAPFQARPYAD